MTERIQKLLATLGVASRREIETMIAEGRIQVNGRPAEIGQKISMEDKVRVDGRAVVLSRPQEPMRVLLYKKRVGEVVTRDDPEGRRTIFRKLPELKAGRWIAVGRLDLNTSGLLLLTNHGELARRLTHPSFEVPRRYAVRVLGEVSDGVLERLRKGVKLDDGEAHFESITRTVHEDGDGANQWFEVMLREGRNREVRRLFESQGLQVSRLIRIAYGPLELGRGIKSGGYREATEQELHALLAAVRLQDVDVKPRTRRPRRDANDDVPFEAKKLARAATKRGKHSSPTRGRAGAFAKPGAKKPAANPSSARKATGTRSAATTSSANRSATTRSATAKSSTTRSAPSKSATTRPATRSDSRVASARNAAKRPAGPRKAAGRGVKPKR